MESLTKQDAIRILNEKEISLFTVSDAKKVFSIEKKNTLYKLLQRLEQAEIIERVRQGKYHFLLNEADDFEIANFLVSPSYVSLESALSFHGILPQFPYSITSITTARTEEVDYKDKKFEFSHVKKDYFFGFEKKNDFLIAGPEKALLDQLYFVSKDLRSIHIEDLDLSPIDSDRFESMLDDIKFKPLQKLVKNLSLFGNAD